MASTAGNSRHCRRICMISIASCSSTASSWLLRSSRLTVARNRSRGWPFKRIEHRQRFPTRLLLLVVGRLLHARQLRLDAVPQALVFLLGRVAIGLVTLPRLARHAFVFARRGRSACVEFAFDLRGRRVAGLLGRLQAVGQHRANPLFLASPLARQPLQIAQQLQLAPGRKLLGGGYFTTRSHAPPR